MEKKFWRCTICGDLHYGKLAPEKCPTCGYARNKAVEITEEEFINSLPAKK